ncbi:MAG: hypothetical protein GWP33_09735 [Alphaproteobacteria bacterium]|nr:hypothetical protein [Alphaproteobacteria bacterium]
MSCIPIFLINLDRREDRMRVMEKRLEELEFHRITAVDGNNLRPNQAQIKHLEEALYPLSENELACILSHLSICEKMLAEQIPFGCVLEDDVILSEELGSFLRDDQWIPLGLDLIKIETMLESVWLSRREERVKTRNLSKLYSFHPGTAGYIISLRGAQKMHKILTSPNQAADDLMFKRVIETDEFGDVWQMVPALCVQEFVHAQTFSKSDINAGRESFRSSGRVKASGINKIMREIRRPLFQILEKRRCFKQKRRIVPFV